MPDFFGDLLDKLIALGDKGKPTGIVYLGFCKAFDTFLHNILVSKLEKCRFDALSG